MTQRYIHELPGWPKFYWDTGRLTGSLGDTHRQERRLTGLLEALPSEVNRGGGGRCPRPGGTEHQRD